MTLDVSTLYSSTGQAKLAELDDYVSRATAVVSPGADVALCGSGPIWLYLKIAHALHGNVRVLTYDSPVTGPVEIFNHNPR